jgi:hypothetical protein
MRLSVTARIAPSGGGGSVPSSLIFTGLVVLWLLILVPAVARHQQEVARPSGALLAGRVLVRTRSRGGRPTEEGNNVDEDDARTVGTHPAEVWVPAARRAAQATVAVPTQTRWDDGREPDDTDSAVDVMDADEPEPDDTAHGDAGHEDGDHEDGDHEDGDHDDDRGWERPPPRYRPGRGGFDPEADAEVARRRYAFRQRTVLALLVFALLTGVAAAAALRVLWWAHAAIDLVLVVYLVYLRRQVREEAAIRSRRASRMAGTRRTSAADDHELDEWARRGREATRRPTVSDPESEPVTDGATPEPAADVDHPQAEIVDELGDDLAEDGDTTRVRGVGEPIGLLPARRRGADGETVEPGSALPPLTPAPPPALPPGTSLVEVDDDDLDLHDLGDAGQSHRRAAGE